MRQKIRACGPKDKPKNEIIINVTSSSKTFTKNFSPFYLGPVLLPNGDVSKNVENAWQFSKVYKQHVDENNNPNDEYWKWAKKGWNDKFAHRYPMGKNTIPLYSYWNGEKLSYIEARKKIYIPIYTSAVENNSYFKEFLSLCKQYLNENKTIYLFDYDGYDNVKYNIPLEDVVDNTKRKMGHVFPLINMLEKYLK